MTKRGGAGSRRLEAGSKTENKTKQKPKSVCRADRSLEAETIWQQSEVWASALCSTWLVWIDDRCALAAAWKRLPSSSSCLTSCRADRGEENTYKGKTTHIAHKAPPLLVLYTCCLPAPTSLSCYWYIHCRTSWHVCTISFRLLCPYLLRSLSGALWNLWCTTKRPLFIVGACIQKCNVCGNSMWCDCMCVFVQWL